MKFIIFIISIIVLFWVTEKLLTKWLGKDTRKISDTEGKLLDRWGRGVILLIALVFLTKVGDMSDQRLAMNIYWISFIIVFLGFQSFMQWKFLKGSKEYLKTLIFLGIALFCWGVMKVIGILVIS
ncbi:DUF4181 domain-containing protein [Bacillus sp. SG-1]|uniref:DUF4181 domain-containing protein n=1 Tax=Bacillus sp. SG-1 TaxID=161544 RepID=UPI0001543360|nr:DUF4181 domain-containing protein [Bacillus sp. SG-1]EDL66293.1 hypothetical protein BSG1_03035 [Bacillus sp. SG-1]